MARLQYKICTSGPAVESGNHEVHVYGRYIDDEGVHGPWKHILVKSAWLDPTLQTRGRQLKALLRSLA